MPELLGLSLYNDANLQEYYRLEDTTGKNGNTLTNNNTVTFTAANFSNGANLGTSNTNKSLSSASTSYGFDGGAYSISLWVNISTVIGNPVTYQLVHLRGNTASKTAFIITYTNDGTKKIQFLRVRDGTGTESVNYNVDLGTSTWHHLVMAYDGTDFIGYLNGINVGTVAATGNGSSSPTTGLTIGINRNDLTSDPASAIFDDVAFFNRNLTAAEVSSIYAAKIGAFLSFI